MNEDVLTALADPNRRAILELLAAHGVTLREPVRFYADPEDGKQWLVGKQH